MSESFDNLLAQYENGTLSRRQLLVAMAMLSVPTTSRAQPGAVRARSLNHVNAWVWPTLTVLKPSIVACSVSLHATTSSGVPTRSTFRMVA